MHWLSIYIDSFGVKIYGNCACAYDGLGMALGAADNCMNSGHEFSAIERFGQIIIGTASETF